MNMTELEELFLSVDCFLPQGIMLVYDICNEKSFENIKNWIRNIEEVSVKSKMLVLHEANFVWPKMQPNKFHFPLRVMHM